MSTNIVGAGILNIITESLYDKPLVVFREYVQNSVDSFLKTKSNIDESKLFCKIWNKDNNLYFLDNGNGIEKEKFQIEMIRIANSNKSRVDNIGYKGIGRLSGISYCKELNFLNIVSYEKKIYQQFAIDCEKYQRLRKQDDFNALDFDDLMKTIGTLIDEKNIVLSKQIEQLLNDNAEIFKENDKGFLVVLQEMNPILEKVAKAESIYEDLGWLLPVKFKDELFLSEQKKLFNELISVEHKGTVPVKSYNITYDGKTIERPIESRMLRDYTCKFDLKYAKGFHSFKRDKIAVEKGNSFSGIRIYIDNMLLCDETEFIPLLREYGLSNHTPNELVQTVNGLGAIIYITDKINLFANARRTFIEMVDEDSIEFLKLLAEFVERIYVARYALSKYSSGKSDANKLEELKTQANNALSNLAEMEITLPPEPQSTKQEFEDLSDVEKKQLIKKKILKEMNDRIKNYLSLLTEFDYDNAFENFKIWFKSN